MGQHVSATLAVRRLRRRYLGGAIGADTFERRLEDVLAPRSASAASGLLDALASDLVIGRSRGCDLVLRDDSVSRRHVRLTVEEDHIVITDLGSTNGTFLNGRWVSQAEARPGDILRLGETELV